MNNKTAGNPITLENGLSGSGSVQSQGVSAGTSDKAPNAVAGAWNTTQINPNGFGIGSSTTNIDMYHPKTLVDVKVDEELIVITYIRRAKYHFTPTTFTVYPPSYSYSPDLALKEIYGVQDGKLTLLKTVNGRVVPPQEIPETLEFDDEIE